ncbi:MAG: T9SS type A sorting domain-containing protein [Bacteroidetes bacterium]|nr:T9SS type A sorting domain-containing protein [Bacteroidota bacterium]MCL2302882.1 T9SS type A sorting domain-containing protein [Lentimicrobiaceae bacterium]
MKKTLLLILAVALCTSLVAQYTSKDLKHVTQKAYHVAYGDDNDNAFTPALRPSGHAPQNSNKGFSHQIGETHYISMTNANARNIINWSPDGSTCAATWTIGGALVGAAGPRGTGLNYFDQASQSWNPIPSVDPLERVETGPMTTTWAPGWGSHVYTENGELVVSHCVAEQGLMINYRAQRHQGAWEQSVLKGPVLSNGKTDILWATVVAVGDIVHMVCVTSNDANVTFAHPEGANIPTCPIYFRSTDGGKNWTAPTPFTFAQMPLEDQMSVSADGYVFTARGNHLVLAYGRGTVAYLESKDGGNSWTRNVVYDNDWSWSSTGVAIGPLMYATSMAVAIGDDGVVHIAFSAQMRRRSADTDPNYYNFYPGLCGLFTWKEGQPTMKQEDMVTLTPAYEIEETLYENLPNFLNAPGLLGFDQFYFWEPIDILTQISNAFGNAGYICHPRLIAQDGKVYLMYSAIIEQPMIFPSTSEFYRGVFLTVSHDNGNTYNQREHTSWLSYHPDYFFCDWSNYGGPNDAGTGYTGWIEFIISSENGYPTMATSIKNDRLIFTWINDYFPYPSSVEGNAPVWVTDPFGVYSVNISIWDAGLYNNTDCVWRGIDCMDNVVEKEKIENLKIYPNPANNMTTIEVGTNNPYTLTVTNIMGQVVHTQKGQQSRVQLNVADYPAGVYIVNVKTANATASQKLIVK